VRAVNQTLACKHLPVHIVHLGAKAGSLPETMWHFKSVPLRFMEDQWKENGTGAKVSTKTASANHPTSTLPRPSGA